MGCCIHGSQRFLAHAFVDGVSIIPDGGIDIVDATLNVCRVGLMVVIPVPLLLQGTAESPPSRTG